MKYKPIRVDGEYYVFNEETDEEVAGPFNTMGGAALVAAECNEDYDPQVYDPRPDPRTHPEYWTE